MKGDGESEVQSMEQQRIHMGITLHQRIWRSCKAQAKIGGHFSYFGISGIRSDRAVTLCVRNTGSNHATRPLSFCRRSYATPVGDCYLSARLAAPLAGTPDNKSAGRNE